MSLQMSVDLIQLGVVGVARVPPGCRRAKARWTSLQFVAGGPQRKTIKLLTFRQFASCGRQWQQPERSRADREDVPTPHRGSSVALHFCDLAPVMTKNKMLLIIRLASNLAFFILRCSDIVSRDVSFYNIFA